MLSALNSDDEYGLKDKAVIVTGAGGPAGLEHAHGVSNGRAAAVLLARSGARLCLVGRDAQALEHTAGIIRNEGGEALVVPADVSLEEDCQRIVETCMVSFGRIDGLDNNVGLAKAGDVTEISLDDWSQSFRTNVDSMLFMCRYAIPHMARNAEGGSIVNIGSLSAARPRGAVAYSVSKGAAEHLTRSVAATHAVQGIRANCIVLGPVYTPLVAAHMSSPAQREQRRNASPIKREGTGWDTAQLVRFLLSEQSRYLTGQCIYLDGGISLVGPAR